MDDDYRIKPFEGDPELLCLPTVFGYDNATANEVFKWKTYPKCSKLFPEFTQALFLDTENNVLRMNCSGSFKGKYVLGTSSFNESFILEDAFNNKVKTYKGPVKLKAGEEWALGTCNPNKDNYFEQIQYKFRKKPQAESRALSYQRQTQKTEQKKLVILLLTIDSVSRRHFFRKLPESVRTLNHLNNETYQVFDFKIHNVIGDNSGANQVPVFQGSRQVVYAGNKDLDGTTEGLYHGDALKGTSLVSYLKDRGYVSLMGFEFCQKYVLEYMGDKPDVDHLVGNLFCGARKYGGFNFEKSALGQRCLGPKMSHYYPLEYIKDFTKGYSKANQFIYMHLTAGHEATGNHIQTLDEDLSEFLESYLSAVKDLGMEAAVFLHGDHGMRYGEWYKSEPAFQEHRLPALFFIGSKSLLDRVSGSYDTLDHNTERLVSKLDIHLTIKHLAGVSLGYTEDELGSFYYNWKVNSLRNSVSLLFEKITNFRDCLDAMVPNYWCSCANMNVVQKSLYNTTSKVSRLVHQLLDYVLLTINEQTHTNPKLTYNSLCQKVTLKEILNVYAQRITFQDESFKIEFSINEHPRARFEAYLVIGTIRKLLEERDDADAYDPIPIVYNNQRVKARLMFLKRLDKYEGICEDLSVALKVNPSLCICNPVPHIDKVYPKLIQKLYSDFKVVLSHQETTCEETCSSRNMHCEARYAELLNNCYSLKQHTNVQDCVLGTFLGFKGKVGILTNNYKDFCQVEEAGLVCPCK